MNDDEMQGFSFQLSASAPPAEVLPHDPGPATDPLGGSDWLVPSALDVPTRTPAPVRAAATPSAATPSAAPAQGPASAGLTVKRIAFPRAAPTVFSESVSQAPRTRLASCDDHDDAELDPLPEDLPGPPRRAPNASPHLELARSVWARSRTLAVWGGKSAGQLALRGGRWSLAAARQARTRAQEAWASRGGHAAARAPQQSTSGDEVLPLVDGTPEPPSASLPRLLPLARLRAALPALAAVGAAGACYFVVTELVSPAGPTADDASASPLAVTASEAPTATTTADEPAADAPAADEAVSTEQLALPEGLGWPGKGLIEVVTAGRELIYVDGVFTGRGPLRRIPVAPGQHDVLVRTETSERKHGVEVVLERRARLVFDGASADKTP